MAIGFDHETNGPNGATTSPQTFSHTTSGSNRFLFVATTQAVEGADDISAMTYNSVTMTKIAGIQCPSDRFIGLWGLVNPASGSNTVSITFSGNFMTAYAVSYTGAKQSAQPDSSNSTTTGASTSFTMSTTVVAANCWTMCYANNTNRNSTVGASTTNRAPSTANTDAATFGDSNTTVGTGSQSLNFTAAAGAGAWGGIMASLAPFVAVTVNSNFLAFM
jgi:hypothetical protein